MLRCNDCRPLILDHLYGLLDAPEAAAVDEHLASCPACAAVRAEAAKVQGLIAEAAKGQFPQVRFEAPTAKPRTPTVPSVPSSQSRPVARPERAEPPVLIAAASASPDGTGDGGPASGTGTAKSRKSFRVGPFLPWAVAAAILLAVPGTVLPVLNLLNRAETARKDADDSVAKLNANLHSVDEAKRDADQQRDAIDRRLAETTQSANGILSKWMDAEKAVAQSQESRKVTWGVVGPAAVQPGAPNEFLVVVQDRSNTPHGPLLAEVRDQNDAVVFSQSIEYEKRRNPGVTLRLPADVWTKLTPKSELFLTVTSVDAKTDKKTELQEKVRLLGPVYATVLTTDKPTYRPGDTLFFRSLTLDRTAFTPPVRDQYFRYELLAPTGHPIRAGVLAGGTDLVRVKNSKVEPILGPDGKPLRGVGTGEFLLPNDSPDGDYTLVLRELPHPAGYPPAVPFPVTRTVKVRSGVAEAYHKQINFAAAASYSAGEMVEAWTELKFQDKPVEGADVVAVAEADNQRIPVTAQPTTGPDGKARLNFALPQTLDRGDVRLKVTFKTKNGEETVAERVPVVGHRLIVEFFPEGGELIAGVPCRVYVRATTPSGHPVDITGVITDGRKVLAEVDTRLDSSDKPEPGTNRGIGSFPFTPTLGTTAWLKLKTPTQAYSPLLVSENNKLPAAAVAVAGGPAVVGSRTGFALPRVKSDGVVMTVLNPVTAPGEPFRVHLRSVAKDRNLVVGAYTRGRLSDTQKVKAKVGELAEVGLMAGTDPRGGVVRITVFEEPEELVGKPESKPDMKAVAERLVFRKPGEALNLTFTTTGTRGLAASQTSQATGFTANTPVELGIAATDEKKNPTAAILYAAVVNTAVAPGANDRLLTTHFLIAGEVNTPDAMEYADFLLTDHPKAAEALDRVLATQGWRRFAEQTQPGFARQPVAPNQECANLLACSGQYVTASEPTWVRDHQKLFETYWTPYETAVKARDAAQAAVDAQKADPSADDRLRQLASEAAAARDEAKVLADRASAAVSPVQQFRSVGWVAVAGFGLLALLLAGAAFTRSSGRLPLGVGTVGSLGLVAFLVFALGVADRTQAANPGTDAMAKASLPDLSTPGGLIEAPRPRLQAPGATDATLATQTEKIGPPTWTGMKETPPGKGATRPHPGPGGPFGNPGGFVGNPGGAFSAPPGVILPKVNPNPPAPPPGDKTGDRYPPGTPVTPTALAPPAPGGADPVAVPAMPPPVPLKDKDTRPFWPFSPFSQEKRMDGVLAGGLGAGAFGSGHTFGGAGGGLGGGMPPPRSGRDGWQPNSEGKKAVPDDLLDRVNEVKLYTSGSAKAATFAPKLSAPQGVTGDTHTGPTRGGNGTGVEHETGKPTAAAAPAFDGAYRREIEVLRKYVDDRAKLLPDTLGRRFEKADMGETQAVPALPGMDHVQLSDWSADGLALSRIRSAVPVVPPLVVREYAAPRPGSEVKDGLHPDADTILWQPVIVLPADGKTKLDLNLGSATGGYQVIVAGHTLDGRIGAVRGIIPVSPNVPTGQPTATPPNPPAGNVGPGAP